VTDGVGSCLFPATYFARWLAWGVGFNFLKPVFHEEKPIFHNSKEFGKFVLTLIQKAVVDYSKVFNTATRNYEIRQAKAELQNSQRLIESGEKNRESSVSQSIIVDPKINVEGIQTTTDSSESKIHDKSTMASLSSTTQKKPIFFSESQAAFIYKVYRKASSTFATVFIDSTESNDSLLRIYQKGDSLVVVFELVTSTTDPNYLVYLPKLITKDQSPGFNTPMKFKSHSYPPPPDDGQLYEQKINEGDIVIVASDGLFDNMYLSFLTFLVNYLASSTADKRVFDWELQEQIQNYVDAFVKKVMYNDPEEDQVDSFKSESSTNESELQAFSSLSSNSQGQNPRIESVSNRKSIFKFLCSFQTDDFDTNNDDFKREKTGGSFKKKPTTTEERLSSFHKKRPMVSYYENDSQRIYDPVHFNKMLIHILKCFSRDLADQGAATLSGTLHQCVLERLSKLKTFHRDHFQKGLISNFNGKVFSEQIAKAAELFSKSQYYWSPFADKAYEHEICVPSTGKPDDITVVASLVLNGAHPDEKAILNTANKVMDKIDADVPEIEADLEVALQSIDEIINEFQMAREQAKKQAEEINRSKKAILFSHQTGQDDEKLHTNNII